MPVDLDAQALSTTPAAFQHGMAAPWRGARWTSPVAWGVMAVVKTLATGDPGQGTPVDHGTLYLDGMRRQETAGVPWTRHARCHAPSRSVNWRMVE
jgi:hypothetical protein